MANVAISGDTSGAVTLTVPATAGTQTVTFPAATGTPLVSGNQPAFSAYLNSSQSITTATVTKAQINAEVFDTANCYDSSTNYRFTPNVAGYYQVNCSVACDSTTINPFMGRVYLYKNGSSYAQTTVSANNSGSNAGNTLGPTIATVVYMNGSTDYLEVYGYSNGATGPLFLGSSQLQTHFSASLVRAA